MIHRPANKFPAGGHSSSEPHVACVAQCRADDDDGDDGDDDDDRRVAIESGQRPRTVNRGKRVRVLVALLLLVPLFRCLWSSCNGVI